MPVYNCEAYVGAAISSILTQSVQDIELIAINDGSQDRSLEVLDNFAQMDSRLHVYSQANGGIGHARNAALRRARGEFVACLDSDDIAYPGRLERQLEFMRTHSKCVALGTHVTFIDADDDILGPTTHELHHEGIERELLAGRASAIWQSSSMMRRAVVLEVGGYDPTTSPAEDLDLYLKLAERGELANLPDFLVYMRRHPCSSTAMGHEKQHMKLKTWIVQNALSRRGLDPGSANLRYITQPDQLAGWHSGYARFAIKNGNRRVALKHLRKAVLRRPFSRQVARAAAETILGPARWSRYRTRIKSQFRGKTK